MLELMINECHNIVAFIGAGVSTDSGLKDFRSEDGLYKQKSSYPVEYLLSHACFNENQELFFKYYKENFDCRKVLPNNNHILLKKLESIEKLKAIITQNIDGLHTKAGSNKVYEIHGSIYKNYCLQCHKEYNVSKIFNSKNIPKCTCGGIIKPQVVLYGESLPKDEYNEGLKAIRKADMLMILGSSLTVYPAASMIESFKGKYLIIINKTETAYDYRADLIIHDNLSTVSKILLENM